MVTLNRDDDEPYWRGAGSLLRLTQREQEQPNAAVSRRKQNAINYGSG